ncbi:MAG: hypothetical protein JXR13_12050 [Thalassovita sp.]
MDSVLKTVVDFAGAIRWEGLGAISTIAIAVIGFVISARLKRRDARTSRYALLVEFRQELINFSEKFFDHTAEGIALAGAVSAGGKQDREIARVSADLSALIDQGRFIFPNYVDKMRPHGVKKGPAFAGIRREPLDAIMAAHLAMEALRLPSRKAEFLADAEAELRGTGQPISRHYNNDSIRSTLMEARRCYLNAVLPETFPHEWQGMFRELLGPVNSKKLSKADKKKQQSENAAKAAP